MPAVEPRREIVTAAILDRLESIAAGGVVGTWTCWYTPSKLTRSLLRYDQYQGLLVSGPVYGVNRSDDSEVRLITNEGQPLAHDMLGQRVLHHDLVVDISGYVLGDLEVPADTKLKRAWADHYECLLADPKLGGLVHALEPYGKEITDRAQWEPFGGFTQSWVARFTERR